MVNQAPWREFSDRGVDESVTRRAPEGELIDLLVIWRARYRIVLAALLGGLIAAVVLMNVTPTYRATAQVLVDVGELNVIDIANVTPDATVSEAFVLSEVAVFASPPLLRTVVEVLALHEDPEFNPMLRDRAPIQEAIGYLRSLLRPAGDLDKIDPIKLAAFELAANIDVRAKESTYIIEVSAWSQSPVTAANIANTLVSLYIESQIDSKFAASERANDWLQNRVVKLRDELRVAEQKVEDFRVEAALEGRSSPDVLRRILAQLSVQLVDARSSRATMLAQYEKFQRLVAEKSYFAATEIASSPLIDEYRRRYANVTSEIDKLKSRYGEDYGGTVQLVAVLDEIERSIEGEVETIGAGVLANLEIAEAEVEALSTELSRLESALANQLVSELSLRELEREAEALRGVYQQFLMRLKEATERGGFQDADARIISHAEIPSAPVEPRKVLMTLVAAVVSGLLTLVVVLVLDRWRSTVISEADVRRCCGLPLYATIPMVPGRRDPVGLMQWMASHPHSAFADAVHWLLQSVHRRCPGASRTVLITSSVPREGRTALALSLAKLSALGGDRTLLIDADIRRPPITSEFLAEQQDGRSIDALGFDILTVARPSQHAGIPLKPAEFREAIATARENYTSIIIDAPAAISLSEVAIMAQVADAVVLACKWNTTPEGVVAQAARHLQSLGTASVGIALTMADLKQQAQMTSRYADYVLKVSRDYYPGKAGT